MTFHRKAEEPEPPRPLRNFAYRVYDGGIEHYVSSHDVYFYEAGRVGFWNDDERTSAYSSSPPRRSKSGRW